MRAMKDSWIEYLGKVPICWNVVRIKYLTKVRNENGLFDPDFDTYIGLENVVGYSNTLLSTETNYTLSIQSVCKKNDVLFGKLRPYLAKIIIAPYDSYCTGEFLVFSSFDGDFRFLRYSLLNKDFIDNVNSSTYGTKMPRANSDYILNLKIVYPPLSEQRRIADFLDAKCAAIDRLSAVIQSEIDTLEQYKRSVITEAVTKGLDPDAEMKDSGIEWIGEIPVGWSVGRIKDKFSVTLGKMLQSTPLSVADSLENYACAANIKWLGFSSDICKQMWFSPSERTEYLLRNDDVLVMEGGTAGTACVYHGENAPCYIQNSVNRCRNFSGYPNKLLYYWLHHVFHCGYIESICNKATIMHYTKEKIENTPLVIPDSYFEQNRIADFLDAKCSRIDALIAKKREKLAVLDSYKKSLIYEYVTGKKEVPSP